MRLFALLFAALLPSVALTEEVKTTTAEYIVRHSTHHVTIESVGATKGHRLKYFNAVVTTLTTDQVSKLEAKGYTVEKTVPMHTLGYPTKHAVTDEAALPWGIVAVQAPQANALKNGSGEGVTVCVVDTGIDASHPALVGSVVGGEAMTPYPLPDKAPWADDNGHGTHVSGTIAAHAAGLMGVAPKAKLYAVKVLNAQGTGTDADVADGIKACIGPTQVINISLGGGGYSRIIQSALDAAVAHGLKIACAAGNDPGPVEYPAAQRGCTAVSAVDVQGHLAKFSAFGKEIAFAAPGVGVRSSIPGGKFDTWDGTSMATPHVAGTMAVMLSRGKKVLKAKDLHLPKTQEGSGEINAFLTAQ